MCVCVLKQHRDGLARGVGLRGAVCAIVEPGNVLQSLQHTSHLVVCAKDTKEETERERERIRESKCEREKEKDRERECMWVYIWTSTMSVSVSID